MNKILFEFLLILFSTILIGATVDNKVAEVNAGNLATAEARWWGFNAEDATQALQNAINSKAKKVIVNKMNSPWIIRPIILRNNLELVFESGVEIIAKKGEFKNGGDCLFRADGCYNLVIEGNNAILRMNKTDYQDKSRYTPSEWRHVITINSSERVTIRNLVLSSSGGDGVYVGAIKKHARNYCKDIVLEGLICDNNLRQGISIISVENLLVKNCLLRNTSGALPAAGIDFEPNNRIPSYRLVNCVMENCRIENNEGPGIEIRSPLNSTAPPHSLTFKDCQINSGKNSAMAITVKSALKGENIIGPGGYFKFINCTAINNQGAAMQINLAQSSGEIVIEKGLYRGSNSAIILENGSNVLFKNPILISGSKFFGICNSIISFPPYSLEQYIKGDAVINGQNQNVIEYLKSINQHETFGQIKILEMNKLQLKEVPSNRNGCPTMTFRGKTDFLLLCRQGVETKLKIKYSSSGRYRNNCQLLIYTPDGSTQKFEDILVNSAKEIVFMPKVSGIYRLRIEPGNNLLQIEKSSAPVSITAIDGMLNLIAPKKQLYFAIPPNTSKFTVLVKSQGGEWVSAALWLDGKLIEERLKIVGMQEFKGENHSNETKIGYIKFGGGIEDAYIFLAPPLDYIVSAHPSTLLTRKE